MFKMSLNYLKLKKKFYTFLHKGGGGGGPKILIGLTPCVDSDGSGAVCPLVRQVQIAGLVIRRLVILSLNVMTCYGFLFSFTDVYPVLMSAVSFYGYFCCFMDICLILRTNVPFYGCLFYLRTIVQFYKRLFYFKNVYPILRTVASFYGRLAVFTNNCISFSDITY